MSDIIDLEVDESSIIPLEVESSGVVPLDVSETFVNVGANLQANKNASPAASQVIVTPDPGYDAMEKVTVEAIPQGTLGVPVISQMTVLGAPTINARCEVESGGYLDTGVYTVKGVSPSSILPTQAGTTITPTTSEQTAVDTHKWTTGEVKVAPIPPEYIIPSGTKNITTNGNAQDVKAYEKVNVSVPNSYSASDEGKVVSSGALVAQTSDTVTANDTYDTTLINSLTVNVSGGGGISVDDMATVDEPSGSVNLTVSTVKTYAFYSRTNITELIAPNVTSIGNYGFYGLRGLKHAFLAAWEGSSSSNNYCFGNCGSTSAKDCVMVFPSLKNIGSRMFRDGWFEAVDLGSQSLTSIGTDAFYPSTYGSYRTLNLILRRTDGVVTVPASDAIKAVYNLWVPQALVSSYETASNWSTRVSGGYLTVHAIEGSIYATKYADGTTIPT